MARKEVISLLALLVLFIPTAYSLEHLFNTTYIQRLASGKGDYSNYSVVWDKDNRAELLEMPEKTRLELEIENKEYNMYIEGMTGTEVNISLLGNNITLYDEEWVEYDLDNDGSNELGVYLDGIDEDWVNIWLTNLEEKGVAGLSRQNTLLLAALVIILGLWLFSRRGG